MKGLNLNDAQKKEYEKSKEEIRAGIAEAIERKKDFHRIVHEEMDRENPDINALAGLMKERVQHIPGHGFKAHRSVCEFLQPS